MEQSPTQEFCGPQDQVPNTCPPPGKAHFSTSSLVNQRFPCPATGKKRPCLDVLGELDPLASKSSRMESKCIPKSRQSKYGADQPTSSTVAAPMSTANAATSGQSQQQENNAFPYFSLRNLTERVQCCIQ